MPKFSIACSWEMYGHFEVEADSFEEAIDKVENPDLDSPYAELPDDGEYVDGSLVVDRYCSEQMNK